MRAVPPAVVPARIAVVTVSYGSRKVLENLLASVAHAASENLLVVVVDNKATDSDNVADLAHSLGVSYLAMDSNVGYGSAVNAAARILPNGIEWILIANPDLVISPRSLDILVQAGDRDSSVASVGPATLTPDGEVYPSARRVPSLRTGVGHALFANLWIDNPWSRAYRSDFAEGLNSRDAGWLSGAC